ncbi:MAG: MFS transporter [archaeon]
MEPQKTTKTLIQNRLRENARKTSIKEGSAASVMSGTGDNFISAFAVALSKSMPGQSIYLAIMGSIASVFSPIAQQFGSRLMEKRSRRSIVVPLTLAQAFTWIPIAILALLAWQGILETYLPYLLVVFYGLYAIFGGLSGPAWFSWMGDIVDDKDRGRYFSKRNRIAGTISLTTFLIAGYFLDIFKTHGLVFIGFAILFGIASSARIVSHNYFKKQYEPELKLKKEYYFSFWQFLKKYTNFTKFVIFQFLYHVVFMFASPFFTVYMLNELKYDYLTFTILVTSGTLFYLMFTPLVGKFSDKYGNKRLLYLGGVCYGISLIPWLFFTNVWVLIFSYQIISGLGTAAYSIGTSNYLYDTVTPQRRGICVAYMNIGIGAGVFIGAMLGGWVLNNIHFTWINTFLLVFGISAVLRILVPVIFIPRIKEVKPVANIPEFSFSVINPFTLLDTSIEWFREVITRHRVYLKKIVIRKK